MRLRQITENDYAGLEDADEFSASSNPLVIGGRMPWAFSRDPKPVIKEVENWLLDHPLMSGMVYENLEDHMVQDGHGGHVQWIFYFSPEEGTTIDPYMVAKKLRKQIKQQGYAIHVPSGKFEIEFVMMNNDI